MLHAVWYEDRAIQLLKFSMSQEVKKGPFAALTFESSKNFILTYFQKLMWFYLLATKDSLLGKVWGETFFRCEMPWTALTEIVTYQVNQLWKYLLKAAVTKSGTGTWGLGPGDVGPGDVEPVDVGPGDVGLGDVGPGDVRPGDVGPGDVGPWEVINKPDFYAEFVKYNFRWSRESCNMLESLSVVADNFQRP